MSALASLAETPMRDAPIDADAPTLANRVAKPTGVRGRSASPRFEDRFWVPGASSRSDTSNNTLHILGDDPRSRFLAYALQRKFDSVQWVNPPNMRNPHGRHIAFSTSDGRLQRVPNTALPRPGQSPSSQEEPIHNLIVTGSATKAVETIGSLRHRFNENSVVCLMQDSLGVAEEVDKKLAKTRSAKPSYLVGHMSQALAYDHNQAALVEMKEGRTALTAISPRTDAEGVLYDASLVKKANTASFLRKVCTSEHLNGGGFPFDKWLRMKLPTLVFSSVVEPMCVVLDCRYSEVMKNAWGRRLMQQLLDEITQVAEALPEVQRYPELQAMFRGEDIRKKCFGKIRGRGQSESIMATQVSRGMVTDINFLNGYFVRRGARLGINLPANEFVMGTVKAKHAAQVKKLKDEVPWEESQFL